MEGLVWRPIAEYERDRRQTELLRRGDEWALGYWGPAHIPSFDDMPKPENPEPMWRHAQDHRHEEPLEWEPLEFAELDQEWRARLFED